MFPLHPHKSLRPDSETLSQKHRPTAISDIPTNEDIFQNTASGTCQAVAKFAPPSLSPWGSLKGMGARPQRHQQCGSLQGHHLLRKEPQLLVLDRGLTQPRVCHACRLKTAVFWMVPCPLINACPIHSQSAVSAFLSPLLPLPPASLLSYISISSPFLLEHPPLDRIWRVYCIFFSFHLFIFIS